MESLIIQFHQVTKSFPSFKLGPIDLSIPGGYIHAVVGSNGAGKSTLFQLIMGLVLPDQGHISVFDMAYPKQEKEIKQQISYVPPNYLGPERWTAKKLALFYKQWYPNWNDRTFASLLHQFAIPERTAYKDLSTGNQRKLLFSLAVSCHTRLMLLDEPTNGYDFMSKQIFYDQIDEWMQNGDRTILIATHSAEEIHKIADYITLMDGGIMIGTFEKDTLIEQWRTIWLAETIQNLEEIPGVIRIEHSHPTRMISSQSSQTLEALNAKNISVLKVTAMNVEEIVTELTQFHRKKGLKVDHP